MRELRRLRYSCSSTAKPHESLPVHAEVMKLTGLKPIGSQRRVNDEGLVRPAPSAPFKRHVSIDKETGNAVGDALSVANHWEIAQKGSQENAFVTLGYVGSRLVHEIAVYEFKIGREKPLIIAVRSRRGLFSALSGICQ
jgi:hypothetical protein